ncbi:hypothetical protein HELRODRAFT_168362 [Helobdella robusta]|uniref:Uncharacterized protein n=1 Tax=Helobdella robusta TaxID=6412 RepID=T1F0H1_HELRO|nr:hypothetical protein HELRODRAFT_168362 [Helobdella robusta]ESO09381.1 hypothetical protein HELRODRAFT_168362 [Helobdella robusta]
MNESNKKVDGSSNVEELTLSAAWHSFQTHTTSHGIPHIVRARSDKYLRYSVDTTIKIHLSKLMNFPAVTICNNNPIRKSFASQFINLTEFMLEYSKSCDSKSNGMGGVECELEKIEKFIEIFHDKRLESGHQLKHLLTECFFSGVPCDYEK